MAFSDARNERDRAETGRNSSNHGGGDARAAAERNREAMGLGVSHNFDSRMRNSRYNQNTIATRQPTLGNIGRAIIGGIPGPIGIGKALIGGAINGSIDPYSGPRGNTTGFSYDGPNRFAAAESMRPKIGQQAPSITRARAQALGPENPIAAPSWWRTPFPAGIR